MSTALTIIKASLKLIGALGQGETPSDADAADGLEALNTMLDSWQTKRLYVYQIKEENFSLTGSKGTYTIGSGGDFNTTRPIKISDAFIRENGVDYGLNIIEQRDDFNRISVKSVESNIPDYLYYETGFPLGTIHLWSVPNTANDLFINSWQTLQSFSGLTTQLSLPPGYERAIKYNLALELAPLFGVTPTDEVKRIAKESSGSIKRVNNRALTSSLDPAVTNGIHGDGFTNFNINRG